MTDDDQALLQTIADRLVAARHDKHLTQVEVANRAGISETHYSQIERSEKNPSITIFLRIIEALDVTSKEVLGR